MSSQTKPPSQWLHSPLTLTLALLALTLTVFGPTLFAAGQQVMANGGADLAMYFAPVRAFGAQQMRQGHIPLWNPHICGGVPFVGAWQSGLFYPPNWVYLFLPLDKGLNLELLLHVFLAGWFTSLWARKYSFHPLACLLAGTMVMFGGAFYLHVYAGHLSMLAACAWVPLLLLSVDSLFLPANTTRPTPIAGRMFAGILALAMMVLAGHPQTVFIAGVTVSLYSVLLLFVSKFRMRALLALGVVAFCGVAIGAVQLMTGLQAASEGVRAGALPYEMAASYSFLPQNLITLLAPGFYGDMLRTPYWGGYFLWEMSLFAGVIGLMLGGYGVLFGSEKRRWAWLILAVLLLVLTLAAYTPLFRLLYDFVPGFNRFRGHSKFNYPMMLFVAMLAAGGLDHLIKHPPRNANFAVTILVGALLIGGFGLLLQSGLESDLGLWKRTAYDLAAREKSYVPASKFGDMTFLDHNRAFAGMQCLIASGTLLLAGIFLLAQQKKPAFVYALGTLGILEMALFAVSMRSSFPLSLLQNPAMAKLKAEKPGDYRVADSLGYPNSAMQYGMYDLWGYEPAVLGRYAAFLKRSQGADPDDGDINVNIAEADVVLNMARLRFMIAPTPGGYELRETQVQLPHVFLAGEYQVATGRDAVYNEIHRPEFDPTKKVVLESNPTPAPKGVAPKGSVRLVSQTTDTLTIEAETDSPTLLVVTDTYSRAWRAKPLSGSSQQSYTVMPADYIFRAVPLEAGKHRLRLEYAPWEYRVGLWISGFSAVLSLLALARYGLRGRLARTKVPPNN